MSEEMFVKCCAPTLAGIKTGSMFSAAYDSREEMLKDVRCLNRQLVGQGLRVVPLRFHQGRALIYVFRPSSLKRDMSNSDTQKLLKDAGYDGMGCEECIHCLMKKLKKSGDFPHEVGLFLSYPPEDVRGFIENHAQNYKFIGYWKVYGDEEKARKTFEQYKKCTDSYCRRVKSGCSLTQLAVAV